MSLANPICEAITRDFHLSTEILISCDKYYILHWSARYVYSLTFRDSRIVREGIAYIPIFQGALSVQELGKNPALGVRLSFRRIRGHKTGYVLITTCPIIFNSQKKIL